MRIHCFYVPMSCGSCGPGYATPEAAMKGPREKVLFVTCPHADGGNDMVAAVDVDPDSATFCQVISRVTCIERGEEVHHTGWNACSSCYSDAEKKRAFLVVPCLNSDRIYILDTRDAHNLKIHKTVEPSEVHKFDVSFPHTSHCLADGNIMISTLGDKHSDNKGSFLLLDGETFTPKGVWPKTTVPYGYDFWYQPRHDVMLSTEWGTPKHIKNGFDPQMVENEYGHCVHLFSWKSHELRQTLDLKMPQGSMPLEVRFKHDPNSTDAFVGTALGSAVYHIHPQNKPDGEWVADLVISIPSKKVSGWSLPEMPGLITDIIISMDDHFIYFSNWLHGDIRQYDITDPTKPKLTGQVFLGGSIHTESGVTIEEDPELKTAPEALYVKGSRVEGGPQMLQLSLDGKRLYVTTSLYKKWDLQFYPNMGNGAKMLQIDVNPEGGISLNKNFLIDFSTVEGGPFLAHEMRYPGGDCTSDIWL